MMLRVTANQRRSVFKHVYRFGARRTDVCVQPTIHSSVYHNHIMTISIDTYYNELDMRHLRECVLTTTHDMYQFKE